MSVLQTIYMSETDPLIEISSPEQLSCKASCMNVDIDQVKSTSPQRNPERFCEQVAVAT